MNPQHTDTKPALRLSRPTTESKSCSVNNKDSSNRNPFTEPGRLMVLYSVPGRLGDVKNNRTPVLGGRLSKKELRGSSCTEAGMPGEAVPPCTERPGYLRVAVLSWGRTLLGARLIHPRFSDSGSDCSELTNKDFSSALASPNAIFLTTSLSGGDTGM
ncbi:hypothetical protein CA11_29140 [Gimesia maris]|nr:hypothetical protein CA11_29140 [Gimesia maris]